MVLFFQFLADKLPGFIFLLALMRRPILGLFLFRWKTIFLFFVVFDFSLNLFIFLRGIPVKLWVKVRILMGLFMSRETVHIQLPDKRGHISMFKVEGQDIIDKQCWTMNLKTSPVRWPRNDIHDFFILKQSRITWRIWMSFRMKAEIFFIAFFPDCIYYTI